MEFPTFIVGTIVYIDAGIRNTDHAHPYGAIVSGDKFDKIEGWAEQKVESTIKAPKAAPLSNAKIK